MELSCDSVATKQTTPADIDIDQSHKHSSERNQTHVNKEMRLHKAIWTLY